MIGDLLLEVIHLSGQTAVSKRFGNFALVFALAGNGRLKIRLDFCDARLDKRDLGCPPAGFIKL